MIRIGGEGLLGKGHTVPKIYWVLMIPIFLWLSRNDIFSSSQWERYNFSELEDVGRLLFDLVVCLVGSFIYIVLIWLCVSVLKYLLGINRQRNK